MSIGDAGKAIGAAKKAGDAAKTAKTAADAAKTAGAAASAAKTAGAAGTATKSVGGATSAAGGAARTAGAGKAGGRATMRSNLGGNRPQPPRPGSAATPASKIADPKISSAAEGAGKVAAEGAGKTKSIGKSIAEQLTTSGDPNAKGFKGKAADAAKDILKETATGAAQGAVVGGGLPGAAVGAAKGALLGAVRNRWSRKVIIALIVLGMIGPMFAMLATLSLVANSASALATSDEGDSMNSVFSSGKTDQQVQDAKSASSGYGIPWQMVLSIEVHQNLTTVDTRLMSEKLEGIDPGGQYRDLSAGSYYSSASSARTTGSSSDDAAAAQKVKDIWTAAIIATVSGVQQDDADEIYDQALSWYLGQGISACVASVEGSGSADTTLDDEQLGNAKTIIGVAKSGFATEADQKAAAVVGLATAMQESGLRNLDGGDRDSVGLFQQRPSAGWGTVAQIKDPAYAAGRFFKALTAVPGWQSMAVTVAAQKVQVSAYPNAYAKWESLARKTVLSNFTTVTAVEIPAAVDYPPVVAPTGAPGDPTVTPASDVCSGANLNVSGDTAIPVVHYVITSPFGPRPNLPLPGVSPFHNGVDMAWPGCEVESKAEPIYAAQAGKVLQSGPYGGLGDYIKIDHGNGFVTAYGHLRAGSELVHAGDTVTVGQQIALMGSTGTSTGCHLYFQTIVDGTPQNPEVVMLRLGVQL